MDLNSISKVLIVKLIDLNFFVTILSALVLIFFLQKNGLSFEEVSVYRIPHEVQPTFSEISVKQTRITQGLGVIIFCKVQINVVCNF